MPSRFSFLLASSLLLSSCARSVDRALMERVVPRAARIPDVDRACALGAALGHALQAAGREGRVPHRAMVIADVTAGFCAEGRAWEEELTALRLQTNYAALGTARSAEITDAREREARARRAAGMRFHSAWGHAQALFGEIGQGCRAVGKNGAMRDEDGIIYLLGLYAGINGVLHDRASGGTLGIPLDIVVAASRGAACLEDERWWHVPAALEAAAQAMVPGLSPADATDPWLRLEAAAQTSASSGVRLGRALQVLVSANAGRDEEAQQGIQAHAQALQNHPPSPDWALLDEYARLVSLHESDLIWTAARGHRTRNLGELPSAATSSQPASDPFAGQDPFGATSGGEEPPPAVESPENQP